MVQNQRPPSIKFYEDKSLYAAPRQHSWIFEIAKACTFGIVRSEGQAVVVVIIVLCIAAVAAYYFRQSARPVTPTTHFLILPQETVGSPEGLPPSQP